LKQPQPPFDQERMTVLKGKMSVKFPNAGVSHDETVAAGAAVLGDTAAAFGKDIIRLLEAAVSALNVIQHSTRTTEHILTSGSKSSVIHALRTLESKKKKKKIPARIPDSDDDGDEDNDNNKENIPDEYEIEDEDEDEIEFSSLSLLAPAASRNRPSKSLFSSSPLPSPSSASALSPRPVQSMLAEANKVPEKLKRTIKGTAAKQGLPTKKRKL